MGDAGLSPDPHPAEAQRLAALLLELAPLVMRTLRQKLARQADAELSVPAFRTLRYLSRHPGVTLLALADHLGMTLPAASKLVKWRATISCARRARSGAASATCPSCSRPTARSPASRTC